MLLPTRNLPPFCMENDFYGNSVGFYVKYCMEFPWKTFSLVIPRGQKTYKSPLRSVVFHGNSTENKTGTSNRQDGRYVDLLFSHGPPSQQFLSSCTVRPVV